MQQKEIEKYEAIAARGLVLFSATLIAALIFFAFVFPWLKAPMPEMVVLNLTNFPRIALDSPDSTMGISVRTQVQNVSLPIAKRLPLNGIEAMWFLKSGYHFAPNSPETGELNLSVYDSQGNAVGKAFGGTPETTFPNSMFDFILGSTDKVALEPIDDYCEATFSSLHRGGYGWLNITFDGVKSLRPIVYSASARKENVYYLHMKSDESSNAKYTSDY
ncbi:MAG: hypothetical protein IBX61_07025, partial [Thermoleophilia bacterium]|nr:hypothetical protein [Thermoleophilia bacterium]